MNLTSSQVPTKKFELAKEEKTIVGTDFVCANQTIGT